MIKPLVGQEIAEQIREEIPQAVVESNESWVVIEPKSLLQVAQFLKTTPGLDFDTLTVSLVLITSITLKLSII